MKIKNKSIRLTSILSLMLFGVLILLSGGRIDQLKELFYTPKYDIKSEIERHEFILNYNKNTQVLQRTKQNIKKLELVQKRASSRFKELKKETNIILDIDRPIDMTSRISNLKISTAYYENWIKSNKDKFIRTKEEIIRNGNENKYYVQNF